ncbi:MAG TPA: branched-chain amino acid ABC transporter permease [Gaiellaceae bacterium]|nr:branched-chain amino acid ABC transporter permease [Gaiellaceae bacterium]
MTEIPVPSPVAVHRRPAPSDLLRWILGALILLGLGYWLISSAVDEPERFAQVTVIGLSNGMIYALVALGYTLVYGIIELINFAHGDNFMLGTLQTQSIFADGSFQIPLLFFTISIPLGTAASVDSSAAEKTYAIAMALVLSIVFCMTVNVAIERIGYKPLRNQPRLAPLITAIGFSFILQGIGLSWKGEGRIAIPQLIPDTVLIGEDGTLLDFGDVPYYTVRDLMVLLITIPVLVALTVLVQRTKPGKAMRATAQDRDASAMMGISVDRTISFTFALGGAIAGAGGVVYALYIGTTYFQLGFRLGLIAFTAAVLGGIGNLSGAVLGGVLIGLISAYNDGFGDARWTYTVIFVILILILVFRPSGLLGERTPEGQ